MRLLALLITAAIFISSITISCSAPKGLSADVKKDTATNEMDSTIILIDTLTAAPIMCHTTV
jgi:hypothetical protein